MVQDHNDFFKHLNEPSFGNKVNTFFLPLVSGNYRYCHRVIRAVWEELKQESECIRMNVRQNHEPQIHWRPFNNPASQVNDCVCHKHSFSTVPNKEGNSTVCIKFHKILAMYKQKARDLGYLDTTPARHLHPTIPWGANTRVHHITYISECVTEDDFETEIQLWWLNPDGYHILHLCGNGIVDSDNSNVTCTNHHHLIVGNRVMNSHHYTVHMMMACCTGEADEEDYKAVQRVHSAMEPGTTLF